jgi:hypothetical protein
MKCRGVTSSRVTVKALALVACVTAAGAVVQAASGRVASLDERIQGAQTVVVAKAREVNASWRTNSYGDRLIVSSVLLDVDENLKGQAGKTVRMDLEGGTLDGVTLKVSDLPELKPGERAVFFLDQAGDSITTPHLRGQGILKLGDDDVVTGSSLSLGEIRRAAQARK